MFYNSGCQPLGLHGSPLVHRPLVGDHCSITYTSILTLKYCPHFLSILRWFDEYFISDQHLPEHKDLFSYSTYIQDQENTEYVLYDFLVVCLLFLVK